LSISLQNFEVRYGARLLIISVSLFLRRLYIRLQLILERMKLVAKYGRDWRLCVFDYEVVQFLQLECDIHKRVMLTPNGSATPRQ